MEKQYIDALREHIPYELNMLDFCLAKIATTPGGSDHLHGENNLAIEGFWLHARNIIEFFYYPKGAGNIVSASDFTTTPMNLDARFSELDTLINEQICHLQYNRFVTNEGKLAGWQIDQVKREIDRLVSKFEHTLTRDARKYWVPRHTMTIDPGSFVNSATNHISSHGYTGYVSTGAIESGKVTINFVAPQKKQ